MKAIVLNVGTRCPRTLGFAALIPAYGLLVALLGCAPAGPDYVRPRLELPAAFKEAAGWKPAQPQDQAARGNWWGIYGDPLLDGLVRQVHLSNQEVQAAAARYRQALALLDAAYAAYYPNLTAGLSATRSQAMGSGGQTLRTTNARLDLTVSWEPDLWGRIRRGVEAGTATTQASAAELGAALLSAQAALVQAYLQLRSNDAQRALLEESVAAYRRALQIAENRYRAGVAPRTDVTQAQAQLQATRAQTIDLGVRRAQLEHAIAVLIGRPPARFAIAPDTALPGIPDVPPALPSALLERRPDVAAAERRVAAANAQLGVARAAYYPDLTLGATAGLQALAVADLFSVPYRFWSLGPTLATTLFDGGAREAQEAQARAAYDQTVAEYRYTVLAAFQEVEDNLAALHLLAWEQQMQQEAARVSRETRRLTENQYRAGLVSYLNVVSAQTTQLAAERAVLDIAGRRLVASLALLKALGGDWQRPARPEPQREREPQ